MMGLLMARPTPGRGVRYPSGLGEPPFEEGDLDRCRASTSPGAGSPAFLVREPVSRTSILNLRRAGFPASIVTLASGDEGRWLLLDVSTCSTANFLREGVLYAAELSDEDMEEAFDMLLPSSEGAGAARFDLEDVSTGSGLNLLRGWSAL